MKPVKLCHNPGAGDEEFSKKELISLIESCGFNCRFSSSNNVEWTELSEIDFIIVAGGDGTVRKITKDLLHRLFPNNVPIALLPMGTANNIAKTLEIRGKTKEIIESWHNAKIKTYDVGLITSVKNALFFLESFGYGLFPYLMLEMDRVSDKDQKTPEDKINTALQVLYKLIFSYDARVCQLYVDGVDHSGKYLLAEIMNTRSIGPNLFLSPGSDPGDGVMEVVLVRESDKDKFASYISGRINGLDELFPFQILPAKEVIISWEGSHVHVDDEIIKLKKSQTVRIQLKKALLEFMVR